MIVTIHKDVVNHNLSFCIRSQFQLAPSLHHRIQSVQATIPQEPFDTVPFQIQANICIEIGGNENGPTYSLMLRIRGLTGRHNTGYGSTKTNRLTQEPGAMPVRGIDDAQKCRDSLPKGPQH